MSPDDGGTMPVSRARLGVMAFGLLSLGVVANVLMQPPSHRLLTQSIQSGAPTGSYGPAAHRIPVIEPPPLAIRTLKDGRPADIAAPASETVRAVQRELHARGYEPGGQDGVAGLVTRAAILAFEEDHALPPTAEPSETLLKAILLGGVGAPAPQAVTSARNEPAAGHAQVVRAVQLHLATLGYIGSKVDGVAGPDTTRAIREFEMDQGTKPIGRITGPLMARLMKAAANRRPVAAR